MATPAVPVSPVCWTIRPTDKEWWHNLGYMNIPKCSELFLPVYDKSTHKSFPCINWGNWDSSQADSRLYEKDGNACVCMYVGKGGGGGVDGGRPSLLLWTPTRERSQCGSWLRVFHGLRACVASTRLATSMSNYTLVIKAGLVFWGMAVSAGHVRVFDYHLNRWKTGETHLCYAQGNPADHRGSAPCLDGVFIVASCACSLHGRRARCASTLLVGDSGVPSTPSRPRHKCARLAPTCPHRATTVFAQAALAATTL